MDELIENEDFYWDGPLMVFTAKYHLKRGYCCGSGCRNCPYEPRHLVGGTTISEKLWEKDEMDGEGSSVNEPRH